MHCPEEVAPGTVVNEPATHDVHAELAVRALYCPMGHCTQLALVKLPKLPLKVPATQAVHTAEVVAATGVP